MTKFNQVLRTNQRIQSNKNKRIEHSVGEETLYFRKGSENALSRMDRIELAIEKLVANQATFTAELAQQQRQLAQQQGAHASRVDTQQAQLEALVMAMEQQVLALTGACTIAKAQGLKAQGLKAGTTNTKNIEEEEHKEQKEDVDQKPLEDPTKTISKPQENTKNTRQSESSEKHKGQLETSIREQLRKLHMPVLKPQTEDKHKLTRKVYAFFCRFEALASKLSPGILEHNTSLTHEAKTRTMIQLLAEKIRLQDVNVAHVVLQATEKAATRNSDLWRAAKGATISQCCCRPKPALVARKLQLEKLQAPTLVGNKCRVSKKVNAFVERFQTLVRSIEPQLLDCKNARARSLTVHSIAAKVAVRDAKMARNMHKAAARASARGNNIWKAVVGCLQGSFHVKFQELVAPKRSVTNTPVQTQPAEAGSMSSGASQSGSSTSSKTTRNKKVMSLKKRHKLQRKRGRVCRGPARGLKTTRSKKH